MQIDFTHEQLARLEEIATKQDMPVREVILESVQARFEAERYWSEKLDRSIAQMERGEFVDEEEMDRRFAAMMQPR